MLRLDGLEVASSVLLAIGGCNNLVEIGLSKCNGVTDEGISSLVTQCSHLRVIDLTCCNLLTNNALDSIAENCKMVERLRLESCSSISEKGLEQIATSCPNLKEIDLTDCGVNDAGLCYLSLLHLHNFITSLLFICAISCKRNHLFCSIAALGQVL